MTAKPLRSMKPPRSHELALLSSPIFGSGIVLRAESVGANRGQGGHSGIMGGHGGLLGSATAGHPAAPAEADDGHDNGTDDGALDQGFVFTGMFI